MKRDKSQILKFTIKIIVTFLVFALFFFVFFIICKFTGFWEQINSIDKVKDLVGRGGFLSILIFMLLQILQTTVLQVPSFFVTVAGAIVFGEWQAFIISYISIMIGSLIMFWIGRTAGGKFLSWLIGTGEAEKWKTRMENGKYLFFLMMLFPMFPDDILCVVAGMTNMSFKFFLFTNLIARGLGIATTVFFGSGAIIPFYGWGIAVWGLIFVLLGIIFYLSIRFKDNLDELVMRTINLKRRSR